MLLDNKSAVIYGGGGGIGGAVARAFAREGATVFLAGRTLATLDAVADAIRSAGGAAETAEVDALDEAAVDRHADAVAAQAGGIDISFNVIAHPYTHGVPLAEMSVDDFMAPVQTAARTTFLTTRAAAPHMIPRRSGVILAFGGPGDRSGPSRDYYLGGTQVAFDAIETTRRQL
jgi:3-oxoacyl-[acyl-carrier protein] reductase